MKVLLSIALLFGLVLEAAVFDVKPRISLGLEFFSTRTHEIVYDPNALSRKISELTWVCANAPMTVLSGTMALNHMELNLYFKNLLEDHKSVMDDYDWLDPNRSEWTHWSHHKNTPLDTARIFGASLSVPFDVPWLWMRVGIEVERKRWKAYNGTYIYSINDGFRNDSGFFSGLGITYVQQFEFLYFALNAQQRYGNITLHAGGIYAPFVHAWDADTHHFRAIQFDTTVANMIMAGFELDVSYAFTETISGMISYGMHYYYEAKGTTTATNLLTGAQSVYAGGAISAINSTIGFGLSKAF